MNNIELLNVRHGSVTVSDFLPQLTGIVPKIALRKGWSDIVDQVNETAQNALVEFDRQSDYKALSTKGHYAYCIWEGDDGWAVSMLVERYAYHDVIHKLENLESLNDWRAFLDDIEVKYGPEARLEVYSTSDRCGDDYLVGDVFVPGIDTHVVLDEQTQTLINEFIERNE